MNKRNIILSIFTVFLILSLVGCGHEEISVQENENENQNNWEDNLKTAEIYDFSTINKVAKQNAAKATEYNGKYFVFYGTITNIDVDNLTLSNNSNGVINVYLDTEILKNLNKNEQISVLGKIQDATTEPGIMKDAKVLEQDELEKYFIIDITEEKGTRYPNLSYSNYKYNDDGKVIEYSVKGDETGTYKISYDDKGNIIEKVKEGYYGNDVTKYEYDENNNLIKESEISYNSDGEEKNKKIFEVNVIKNSDGKVIQENSKNVNSPDFSYEYTYEYENDKLVTETEYDNHSNGNYTSTYTYDSYGNKLTKVTKGDSNNTVKYTYSIVAKK